MNYHQRANIHNFKQFFQSLKEQKFYTAARPRTKHGKSFCVIIWLATAPNQGHMIKLLQRVESSMLPLFLWSLKKWSFHQNWLRLFRHLQLINFCSFLWGATQIQIHLSCPLTSRCIRPLCIAVVMLHDLPGSTQDCLSLQAEALLLLNVPHICVHLLHPHMHAIMMHHVIPKKKQQWENVQKQDSLSQLHYLNKHL